jgi:hypothetical protein
MVATITRMAIPRFDAMARLAQDFNVRYPLVDGQGSLLIDGITPLQALYRSADDSRRRTCWTG